MEAQNPLQLLSTWILLDAKLPTGAVEYSNPKLLQGYENIRQLLRYDQEKLTKRMFPLMHASTADRINPWSINVSTTLQRQ